MIKGRQRIKYVLRQYILWKYVNNKPDQPAVIPELSDYRVTCNHALEVVGVDYADPLYCRYVFSSNNDAHKCYTLLFTSAFSREFIWKSHQKFVLKTFWLAFKHLISRRVKSSKFVSDSAKSFKYTKIKSYLNKNEIKWIFILERASWWGGFCNVFKGIVKNSLKKVLQKALLNYEEL